MARKSDNTALNNLADRLNSSLLDNRLEKTITLESPGDGNIGEYKLFNVTGVVNVQLFGVVLEGCDGPGGTISVGTTLSPEGLIVNTPTLNLEENEIWYKNDVNQSIELTSVLTQKLVFQDIIYKIEAVNFTAGKIKIVLLWSPVTSDGNITL